MHPCLLHRQRLPQPASPPPQARTASLHAHLGVAQRLVGVGGHDHVGVLNHAAEGQEGLGEGLRGTAGSRGQQLGMHAPCIVACRDLCTAWWLHHCLAAPHHSQASVQQHPHLHLHPAASSAASNPTIRCSAHLLGVQHQLQEAAVNLVDGHHGADALAQRLAQHGLGLHAHALNAVHHHQSTVGDAQRRRHLRREVDVA